MMVVMMVVIMIIMIEWIRWNDDADVGVNDKNHNGDESSQYFSS